MPARFIPIDLDTLYRLYHVEKQSLSAIGRVLGCSTQTVLNRMRELGISRRNVSESTSLVPRTDEWKAKIGKANRGHSLSANTRAAEQHWNWKGGVSAVNNRIRQSSEYKTWRDAVFRRDGWKCIWCRKGGYVEADHIEPFASCPERRFDVTNGRTLCRRCHKQHTSEQRKTISSPTDSAVQPPL